MNKWVSLYWAVLGYVLVYATIVLAPTNVVSVYQALHSLLEVRWLYVCVCVCVWVGVRVGGCMCVCNIRNWTFIDEQDKIVCLKFVKTHSIHSVQLLVCQKI